MSDDETLLSCEIHQSILGHLSYGKSSDFQILGPKNLNKYPNNEQGRLDLEHITIVSGFGVLLWFSCTLFDVGQVDDENRVLCTSARERTKQMEDISIRSGGSPIPSSTTTNTRNGIYYY